MLRHTSSMHTRRCWKRLVSPTARLSSCCEVIKTARFGCFVGFSVSASSFPVYDAAHSWYVFKSACCQQRVLKQLFCFPFLPHNHPRCRCALCSLHCNVKPGGRKLRDTNLNVSSARFGSVMRILNIRNDTSVDENKHFYNQELTVCPSSAALCTLLLRMMIQEEYSLLPTPVGWM